MAKKFLSGNEAFAEGIRLAKPQVISAYPITPQTIVVEKLSEMVEDGSLKSEFIHVESEHSALSCAMGASAVGARADVYKRQEQWSRKDDFDQNDMWALPSNFRETAHKWV